MERNQPTFLPNAKPSCNPTPMPSQLILRRYDRTHPLVWIMAFICAIIAIAVIIAGLTVFIIYMIYHPKTPSFRVAYAHLNRLEYDQMGLLGTEMAITIFADNHNTKATIGFSEVRFSLYFHGKTIAFLRAEDFEVPHNSSSPINYLVPSSGIPLQSEAMDAMYNALQQDKVEFELRGKARTRWKVAVLESLSFWTRLSCRMDFATPNGSTNSISCGSANQ